MGYTEIDGRIDGESRKYTKSHLADANSVYSTKCGFGYETVIGVQSL